MSHDFFQLQPLSLKTIQDVFNKTFPKLLEALKQKNTEEFIRLIADFASFFIRRFAQLKGKEADFIDEFNKMAIAFMQFHLQKRDINENNFREKSPLNDDGLVEYGKIVNLCRELSYDYLEIKANHHPTPTELVRFARLHVVRPFILNLLPIDLDELCEFSSKKTNIEATLGATLLFYETLKLHVLAKNQNDIKNLDTISKQLEKIQYRLQKDKHSWLRRILMQSPGIKLWLVGFLLDISREPNCTLGKFDEALASTLENKLLREHRHYFTCCFGQLFKFQPPKIVGELENIQSLLHERVFAERIAHRLA